MSSEAEKSGTPRSKQSDDDLKNLEEDYQKLLEDSQNLIVNNSIFDVDDYGIYLAASSDVSVMDNEFRNGTQTGDYCIYQSESSDNGGANIENNKFNDCNVAWRSGSSSNTFRDNTLKDNEYGVLLSGTEANQNLLHDNNFDDSVIAVYIYNTAYDNHLYDNFFDSDDYDIKLSDSYDTVSYNNTFSDISVASDANMWIKVYIDVDVTDNSSNAFSNVDLEIKEYTFAPDAPKEWKENPNEWLTSIDILEVMKQYEKTYRCFDFIGPSPIDYDKHVAYGECVWEELCKFQLKDQIIKDKTKIGIIFNLDKHTEDGSHWVAMFINIKTQEIYYFDSYGDKPPKLILNFVKRVQSQGEELNLKFEFDHVSNRHQYSNSECGMFSLFFIIELLKDTKNFNDFQNKKFSDKYMKKLRKIYFNPHTSKDLM